MPVRKITVLNDLNELSRLNVFVSGAAAAWKLGEELSYQLNLVTEEVVSNIILYGYSEGATGEKISLELSLEERVLKLKITDRGKAFNPLQVPPPDDLLKPANERKTGGLGVYFIRQLMDDVEYERKKDTNILVLTKNLYPPNPPELKP